MVGAQHPDLVGQQLPEQLQRGRGIATLAGPVGDVAAGSQDVGVVGAQHPDQVGQQLPGQLQRGRGIATLAGPVGDVAAGGQDVGVIGAQHPDQVGQQLPGQLQRGRGVTALAGPVGDVAAGGQDVGVVGALQVPSVGEFFGVVLKRVPVAAKLAVVPGQGVVEAEAVFVCGCGGGVQFCFQDDDLEPDVAVRSLEGAKDGLGGVLLLGGTGR